MKQGNCVHYNGLNNGTCKADHDYFSVAVPPTRDDIEFRDKNYPRMNITNVGIINRLPCFAKNGISTCPDFREPTQAELDEQEVQISKLINQVGITRKAIVEYCEQTKRLRGTAGQIPCPICETGKVNFTRAAYNGHIHAQCTTPGCVEWIE